MNKKKFSINEIIAIVMNQIEEIEALELYGIREESNLPIPILEKMYNMDKKNCEDFKSKIQEITEEILFIKTGELNELNRCHEEIMILANEILSDYLE